jgi:hypothetical protein
MLREIIIYYIYFNFIGQTPQDLAAMKEAQNNYQKLCRESSNSENRYLLFIIKKKKKKKNLNII